MELSVVLPVLNEETNVEPLVTRISAALDPSGIEYEVVFVDDGSTDRTVPNLIEMRRKGYPVKIAVLKAHRGQHGAVLAGLSVAGGRFIIVLDADLQDPPEEIPRFLEGLKDGADLVDGYRLTRDASFARKLSSKLINIIAVIGGADHARDLGCMFRGFSRNPVSILLGSKRPVRYIPAAFSGAKSPGGAPLKHKTIEYSQEPRSGFGSKYRITSLVKLLADMIYEFDGIAKLRIFGAGAFFVFTAALLAYAGGRLSQFGCFCSAPVVILFGLSGIALVVVPILPHLTGTITDPGPGRATPEIEIFHE